MFLLFLGIFIMDNSRIVMQLANTLIKQGYVLKAESDLTRNKEEWTMSKAEKAIEKAFQTKCGLAKEYSVDVTSIVWKGGNKFIIVNNGKEIEVETE